MGSRFVLLLIVIAACRTATPELSGGTRAPLGVEAGHLTVRAEVDGHPVTFIVDTGASITALTTTAAARLGILTTGTTPLNGQTVRTGLVRRLSIAGADHADVRIAMVELLELEQRRAWVDGVLGQDVLGRYDVVIDVERRVLRLHPAKSILQHTDAAKMIRVPLERAKHGLLVVRATLENGNTIPAIIDLGSPISFMNLAAASAMHWERQRFALGDVETTVSLLGEDLPVFARLGLSGPALLLGTDVFARRTLAIAYADAVMLVSR